MKKPLSFQYPEKKMKTLKIQYQSTSVFALRSLNTYEKTNAYAVTGDDSSYKILNSCSY